MKNVNQKLEQYAATCDEVYLSKHLKTILDAARRHVVEIRPKELYKIRDKSILIDVREPEEFASGYINGHAIHSYLGEMLLAK